MPALLDVVAPHLFIVSINGADSHPAQRGSPQLIQPLGHGSYDVGIVLRKLRALGFHGPIALQCYKLNGEPRTFLATSMQAWKKFSGVGVNDSKTQQAR